MERKFCAGCQNDLDISEFTIRKTGKRSGQPVSRCKKCRLYRQNKYKNGEKFREKSLYDFVEWPSKIRRAYGIEPEDYYRMLEEQGGGCAICKSKVPGYNGKKRFAIDHCHTTGKVRGVLCHPCNKALGSFKDDPNIMIEAAAYIRKSRQET
jgi:hypothetical protein